MQALSQGLRGDPADVGGIGRVEAGDADQEQHLACPRGQRGECPFEAAFELFQDNRTLAGAGEAAFDVDVITPAGGELTRYRGFGIQTTMPLAEARADDYLMLYVPGGLAPTELRDNPQALDFVRACADRDKPLGLVCHGPQLLLSAGLAAGGAWVNEPVVRDRQIFTSRKPGDPPAELHAIMAHLDALTSGAADV